IDNFNDINWPVIVYSVIGVSLMFIIGLIIAITTTKKENQRGVIWQVVFRANYAIIGIPLAEALGGTEAVAVVALVSAFIVPLINIFAVIALTTFIKDEDNNTHPFKQTVLKIVKNPLIIAIFLGLIVLWIRSFIPVDPLTLKPIFSIKNNIEFLYLVIKWIGQIASPLALIILGGTFEFFAIRNMAKQVVVGTFSRVVIAPLMTLPLAIILSNNTTFFNFTSTDYPALIALFASPVAVVSAIMAREMKNDEKLAVQLVVWTTTISIVSIFIIVFIFRSIGLL
ncbi:MAG: AEC family transporter, partial [Tenericutes bacterium]|nr:AEC family transporter [Mycoplasmatota bacterium]